MIMSYAMPAAYPLHPAAAWDRQLAMDSPQKTGYQPALLPNPRDVRMFSAWSWCSSPGTNGMVSSPISSPQYPYQVPGLPPMSMSPISPASHQCFLPASEPSPSNVTITTISEPSSLSPTVPSQHMYPSSAAVALTTTPTGTKRGRPRADILSTLQFVGSTSTCTIRCRICNRVFPREKSLQAHLRTHTGERPYRCDYPNCTKSFVQSGQLKTHQRLHSGEKPFKCSEEGCNVRFTHANRHCTEHPQAKLTRDDEGALKQLMIICQQQDTLVSTWLDNYIKTRLERNAVMQKSNAKRDTSDCTVSSDDDNLSQSGTSEKAESEGPKRSVKRQLLHPPEDKVSLNATFPPAGKTSLRVPHTSSESERKILSPRNTENKNEACQPVKKRILAYSKQLMQIEEQENLSDRFSSSFKSLPPVSFLSPKNRAINDIDRKDDVGKLKGYSFVKDLESVNVVKQEYGESFNNKCSVIVRRDSLNLEEEETKSVSTKKCTKTSENGAEDQIRWNSALALIELASSPPSKYKKLAEQDTV